LYLLISGKCFPLSIFDYLKSETYNPLIYFEDLGKLNYI